MLGGAEGALAEMRAVLGCRPRVGRVLGGDGGRRCEGLGGTGIGRGEKLLREGLGDDGRALRGDTRGGGTDVGGKGHWEGELG